MAWQFKSVNNKKKCLQNTHTLGIKLPLNAAPSRQTAPIGAPRVLTAPLFEEGIVGGGEGGVARVAVFPLRHSYIKQI